LDCYHLPEVTVVDDSDAVGICTEDLINPDFLTDDVRALFDWGNSITDKGAIIRPRIFSKSAPNGMIISTLWDSTIVAFMYLTLPRAIPDN
jgi:hypothetical protein